MQTGSKSIILRRLYNNTAMFDNAANIRDKRRDNPNNEE